MPLVKRIEFSGHSAAIYSIVGHQDYFFTASGDKFVAKWNSISGVQEKFSIKLEESIFKICLSNSGQNLFIGTSSGSLHIIDLLEKKEIKHYIQHKSAIFEIKENLFAGHIYSTDADGNLAVWDLFSFELLLFLPLNCGKIRSIFVQEDFLFLACQNGEIKQLDTKNFNEINSFQAHDLGVNCVLIHPEKKSILMSAGKDGFIKFWDLEKSNNLLFEIPAHNFGIYQLDFINFNKNFVSVSRDKSIKIWDSLNLKVIQKIERKQGGHSHAVNAFWKKSENEIITVGDDKRIILWELNTILMN
jgi:WD40 repeat protein